MTIKTKPATDEYRDNWDRIFGGKLVELLRENRGRLEEIMEYKTISIQRFRSPDGAPTCCADRASGQECRFLGVRNFGMVDVCMLGEQRDLSPRTADFQRPDARCEVWADHDTGQNGSAYAECKPHNAEIRDGARLIARRPSRWMGSATDAEKG